MKTFVQFRFLLALPFLGNAQIEGVYEAKFTAGATKHRAAIASVLAKIAFCN